MDYSIIERFKKIRTWNLNGVRAPHKPLLILFGISKFEQGQREILFEESLAQLRDLFELFGPPRKPSPEHPFTRLTNDSDGLLWKVKAAADIDTLRTFSQKQLIDRHVSGSFSQDVQQALRDPDFKRTLVSYLLDSNFPESIQTDILDYLNLELDEATQDAIGTGREVVSRRIRDPLFRKNVLDAYERSCAICGYQVRRGDTIVGLEAAHIKWHQAGGPDNVVNGIAMCALHHKLFDYGLFSIDPMMHVKVSTMANGAAGLQEWLLNFHNKQLRTPARKIHYPEPEYTAWQAKEVFKGYSRD